MDTLHALTTAQGLANVVSMPFAPSRACVSRCVEIVADRMRAMEPHQLRDELARVREHPLGDLLAKLAIGG